MRRRKTWIAVTCMLSLTLAGSLFENHAFAADGNGIGEHIGHAAAETTTSIEEELTEGFTNAGNVATLPVPNAEENSNISGFQMIQCILSASNIKCITIC